MASTAGILAWLVVGALLLQNCDGNLDHFCRDAKKKGLKVDCPGWTDNNCNDCDWWEMHRCDTLDKGTCGRGIRRETRARTCTYKDEGKNQKVDCQDTQDRKEICKLQCGPNGKYNVLLDFCECKENWDGTCCDKKIEACTNPIVKKGETDRSIVTVGRGNRCDARLRPSWYTFDSPAGNLMPTECVPYSSCNTAVPFWLNGTHPKVTDGVVDRLACGTQDEDCCAHKLRIKVRNCGQHMAYYLVPTEGCQKAYCVGSHEKCPDGESSDTGFQPGCSNEFPDVDVTPSVNYFIDEQKTNDKVSLTCSGSTPDFQPYIWRAQWFFNGEAGTVQQQDRNAKPGQPRFLLPSKDWKAHMGTMCTCALQAKLRNGKGTWSQSHIESKDFFLGIVVTPSVINVKEGESAEITLKPNLPVRCSDRNENMGHCELAISLTLDPTAKGPKCPGDPKEISQVIFQGDMESHCGFRDIKHTNWHQKATLKIKPKVDIQLDKLQTRRLRMQVHEKDTSVPELWAGHILSPVTINIIDADDSGSCTLVNDPHIKTFDGRLYDFHDQPNLAGNRGIFTIYKHAHESEEVQGRFFNCNGRVYCICGVAIRAGDSTVVFDRCRTQPTLMPELNYKVKGNKKPDPRLRVFKHNSGTEYHIFLPTGTQVKVFSAGSNLIWIEVKASVDSKGKAMGLCGDYNGNWQNDLQTHTGQVVCQAASGYHFWCQDPNFRNSWVVKEELSIFQGNVPDLKPEEQIKELFCDCISHDGHAGYEDCDYHKRYEPCDAGYELFSPKAYSEDTFSWLSNYRAPEHVNPAYAAAVQAHNQHYYSSFAAENTWTEITAHEYCTKRMFSSEAVKTCLNEVPNQNYNSSIDACALDLVLTGSEEFAASHLEGIKSACNQELRMNLELWEPREEEEPVAGEDPKPAVGGPPLRLMENLCPNECSGNGACIDGQCTCKADFSGYDCSLSLDIIPTVKGVVSSSNPCNKDDQDCHVIALEGINFIEGPKLACHYYKEDYVQGQYFYQGPAKTAPVATSPGTLYSMWVVQCSVPEILSTPATPKTTFTNLQVALSNDGNRQTDRFSYASYDFSCEQCQNGKCTRKNDMCIIGSRCFSHAQANGAETEKVCNPTLDPYAWSPASSLITTTVPTTTGETDDGVKCDGGPSDVSVHRDPKDCGMYYVCEGSRRHHMPCPQGLAFSATKKTCVQRSEVPECN